MAKTALETTVAQHGKDLDSFKDVMKEMLQQITGLREDMSERGERMIGMMNLQNIEIIKKQTDHEAQDIQRFADNKENAAADVADLKLQLARYVGIGIGASSLITFLIGAGDLFLRSK